MSRAKEVTRTVIPALPGWYVAIFQEAGEQEAEKWEDSFYLQPILAWETKRHDRQDESVFYSTWPITLQDGNMENSTQQWAVKTPDGVFEFVACATCDTEAQALAYARERHEERERWEQERRARPYAVAAE